MNFMLIIYGPWKETQEPYDFMKEMVLSQQEKRNWKKVRQNISYSYGEKELGCEFEKAPYAETENDWEKFLP